MPNDDTKQPTTNDPKPVTITNSMPPIFAEDALPPMPQVAPMPNSAPTVPPTIPVQDINNPSPASPPTGSVGPTNDVVMDTVMPAVVTTTPKKKFAGGKIIATILGLFLLVGGIGAGVYLTGQNQNISEKADDNGLSPKEIGEKCQTLKKSGDLAGSMMEWGEVCGADKEKPIKCLENVISIHDKNWSMLNNTQLSNLKTGDKIYLTVPTEYPYGGNTYKIKAAKFFVNGTWRPEVTTKSPDGKFFYDEYTLPAGRSLYNIFAEVQLVAGGQWIGFSDLISFCQLNFKITPDEMVAQCQNIRAYSESWVQLTKAQLSALKASNKVNFCVIGTKNGGSFDKAKFTINGVARPETTTKRPNTAIDFCDLYTIPAGTTTFNVTAQIHHNTLGWK